jgi:hypothetical protein
MGPKTPAGTRWRCGAKNLAGNAIYDTDFHRNPEENKSSEVWYADFRTRDVTFQRLPNQ